MSRSSAARPPLWRRVVVLGVATAQAAIAVPLLSFGTAGWSRSAAGAAALDAAVGRAAATVAGVLLLWLAAGLGALTLAAGHPTRGRRSARRHRWADAITDRIAGTLPRSVRLGASAALGVMLVAGSTVPSALAVPAAPTHQRPTATTPAKGGDPAWLPPTLSTAPTQVAGAGAADGAGLVDPAWTPPRPADLRVARSAGLLVQEPRGGSGLDGTVVVRRADTLWDIAARHLPGHPTDAEIAAEWPRWYSANQHVIGADPDHLEPGQVLRVPPDTVAAGATDD